jgi:hypothetical protein
MTTLLGLFFILKISSLFAQYCEGPALFSESFDGDSIPANWKIFDLDQKILYPRSETKGFKHKWQMHNHFGRKCAINYSRFESSGNPDDYLFLPPIPLGNGPICLSWLSAKAISSNFFGNEGYKVVVLNQAPTLANLSQAQTVATFSENSDNWNSKSVDLSSFQGQTVYIGFHHNAPANGYFLANDDIRIGNPVQRDTKILEVKVPDIVFPGTNISISGKVLNGGLTVLNSTDVKYNLNNGPVSTLSLSNLNLSSSSSANFQFPNTINVSSTGLNTLRVWTHLVNGLPDLYSQNDTLTSIFFVANRQKIPLHEQFTQASCPPCAVQNPRYDSLLDVNHKAGKVNMIKYHTGWPGTDPMNALNPDDVLDKVIHYGVLFVPNVRIDGVNAPFCNGGIGNPMCVTQAVIDQSYASPSIFDIQISTQKVGSNYQVQYSVKPDTDFPLQGYAVHAAVFEDSLVFDVPPGFNATLIYPQVMRKLWPNANGMLIPPLAQGQAFTQNFSVPILPEYTESQLRVLVFVENKANKKIYQSKVTNSFLVSSVQTPTDENQPEIFPNPTKDRLFLKTSGSPAGIQIFNHQGQHLEPEGHFPDLDVSSFPSGLYLMKIEMPNGKSNTLKWIKE